ncbi:MAG: class I SAM-dependent methyltransferase [Acidobacteria bacterium]|nr:class I SAM-dependent methyltransferase [Acidobacteriota bacterium]
MNIFEYNSRAWDGYADDGIEWSVPVTAEEIARAREGDWSVVLTPLKKVPREWFGDLKDKDVLCLASGGGQQAPILAAAGARVTSFDASAKQLEKDRFVAARDGLEIRIEQGDAADLSRFPDAGFDLVFHPCSNCFIENIEPVWREAFRVLRSGGALLAGFNNPFVYIFDRVSEERDRVLKVRHRLPYSDAGSLDEDEKRAMIEKNEAFEFSHTLDEQLGGQLAAGFLIAGFYEDYWTDEARLLNQYAPSFIATRALKP